MNTTTMRIPTEVTRNHIFALLDDLPTESLFVVERFVQFMRQQTYRGQTITTTSNSKEGGTGRLAQSVYLYPTKSVPASTLSNWLGLLDTGYEADALADTEALYDEV